MNSKKILTDYVSEMDQFLQTYDKKNPELSKSQRKEIAKHQRVQRLRDDADAADPVNTLWDDF